MSLKIGDKAPSFKLFDTDKKEVSLEDFAGKNLIVHFPKESEAK
jgi:peroxiredoxin